MGMGDGVDPRVSGLGLKPKVLARMAAIGADAEFGRLLAIGTPTLWPAYLLMVVPVMCCGLGVGAIGAGGGNGPSSSPDLLTGVVLIVLGVLQGVLLVWVVRKFAIEWRFHDQGVTKFRRGIELSRLSYMDVWTMAYSLKRQHYHGVYVGTTGTMRLECDPRSKQKGVRHQFRHLEKGKGFLKQKIEGIDPMDVVRDVVAECVSERLAVQIAETGQAPWTGAAVFTKQGLSVKKMLGGATVVPYETIDRMAAKGGAVSFFQEGQKGAAVSLAVNGKNFWPGFVLLRRLLTPRAGEAAGIEDEGEEFADED
jgi:hypothetical protein